VRLNTLKMKEEIGQGGFGTVFLMHDELTGQDVAVKFIHFRQKNGNANAHLMQKEVEALSKLTHKHIVKMYEYFPHPNKDQLVVLMEYLRGGELYDYWHRFKGRQIPEAEIRQIMRQLMKAIDYCHAKKIIHRDLKFQNLLLQEEIDQLPN